MWHHNAGMENAGVDLAAGRPVCRADITMVMCIFSLTTAVTLSRRIGFCVNRHIS